ncbi:hypothetical protein EGI22_03570 [Lacihabitans sp. LS3-19]|uniref:LptE family protein n=1 Tax=Lacihabitans sp. LS3-19 TaxID=2487335 RepID=UPI0020CB7A7A|nr:LptE family protein [Lacihabitans sp. LS3-19]MCP9766974.1 hypothetical protein [Lacihabitans sp. LS3-19]
MRTKYSFFFLPFLLTMLSCGIYKFNSASLSPDYKTFSIQNFTMSAAGGPQNMSLSFSDKLKEYYQRNTNLKFKNTDGDLHLEGSVISYEQSPVSATAGDKAAMNRLTITVEVRFVDKIDEQKNFEKEFSFYQDFSQETSLTQAETTLVPKILDQLVLNIFNATASSW